MNALEVEVRAAFREMLHELREIRAILEEIEVTESAPHPVRIGATFASPQPNQGAPMPSPIVLAANQHVIGTVTFYDANGNAVTGVTLDAGTLQGTFSPDSTELSFSASPDQTQFVVQGLGPVTVPTTLTLAGSVAGVPLTADPVNGGVQVFDVTAASGGTPATIGATFSAPVAN